MTSKLIPHLNRSRYTTGTDEDAVNLAHKDLLSAPESFHSPMAIRKIMHATDVLRQAAMWSPHLLTDLIISDCMSLFPHCNCNGSSRLNIVTILGLLRRKDAVKFLEEVRDDPTRPNVTRVVKKGNEYLMEAYRDENEPDWVTEAAIEALQIIAGERQVGHGNDAKGWIYTFNPEQI